MFSRKHRKRVFHTWASSHPGVNEPVGYTLFQLVIVTTISARVLAPLSARRGLRRGRCPPLMNPHLSALRSGMRIQDHKGGGPSISPLISPPVLLHKQLQPYAYARPASKAPWPPASVDRVCEVLTSDGGIARALLKMGEVHAPLRGAHQDSWMLCCSACSVCTVQGMHHRN
jgi:hypothetical protein